jgi:hypothetical protein
MSYGLHLPDFVKVWINGTERTSYVTSYERTSSLCQRADTFTISFTKGFTKPDPYAAVEIQELYEGSSAYVIKGYLISINEDFQKSTFDCIGQDKSILLDDFFIYYKLDATGQTVDYWITHIASLVGLSVKFDSYTSATIGEPDAPTPMGMQTAGDVLNQLERAGAYYIKYDGDLDKLRVFRYKIERPAISLSSDKTTSITRTIGTEKTRNVVKVYGGWKYNIFTGKTTPAFGKAKISMPEMIVDKTTVIANPLIKRDSVCRLVASRILTITGNIDDVMVVDTHGFYPNVKVGQYASVDVSVDNLNFNGELQITTISAQIDKSGAVTSFKIGDKCPRITIVPPPEVVFAAGTGAGALISLDAGDTFEPFFEGLSGTAMNSWSIACNKYNQLMLLTQAGVYKRSGISIGTSWGKVTTLDNTTLTSYENPQGVTASGMTKLKVEKSLGVYNTFHILGYQGPPAIPSGIQNRYWIVSTKNFGSTWTSMPLYVPSYSGIMPPELTTPAGVVTSTFLTSIGSGVSYNVIGYDVEGDSTVNTTVLVAGAGLDMAPPSGGLTGTIHFGGFQKLSFPYTNQRTFFAGVLDTTSVAGGYSAKYLTNNQNGAEMIATCSIPANREIAYHLGVKQDGFWYLFREALASGWTGDPERLPLVTEWLGGTSDYRSSTILVDYKSLRSDNTVKLAIPTLHLYNNSSPNKCLQESQSYIGVGIKFITDDIRYPGSGIISENDVGASIGSTEHGYTSLYGWTSHPGTATSAWRGFRNATIPPPSKTFPTAVSENPSGSNTGTLCILANGNGQWAGGEYSADEPELGYQHLRDIDEKKNVGLYIITFDFDSETITNISCQNYFLDYVPTITTYAPQAYAVRNGLTLVDIPDETSFWVVDSGLNMVGAFNKMGCRSVYPQRDVPYYGGDVFLYETTQIPSNTDPPSSGVCVYSSLEVSNFFTPPPTSGIVKFRTHPEYGHFGHVQYPNNGKLYKAERATPITFYSAGFGFPLDMPIGGDPNFSYDTWDFRTASGGAWMNN